MFYWHTTRILHLKLLPGYSVTKECAGECMLKCLPLHPSTLRTGVETWISRSGLRYSRVGLSGVGLKLGARCPYKQILAQALKNFFFLVLGNWRLRIVVKTGRIWIMYIGYVCNLTYIIRWWDVPRVIRPSSFGFRSQIEDWSKISTLARSYQSGIASVTNDVISPEYLDSWANVRVCFAQSA